MTTIYTTAPTGYGDNRMTIRTSLSYIAVLHEMMHAKSSLPTGFISIPDEDSLEDAQVLVNVAQIVAVRP